MAATARRTSATPASRATHRLVFLDLFVLGGNLSSKYPRGVFSSSAR